MWVVIDHRESADEITVKLEELGCTTEKRRMDVGGYLVDDRLIVERKTLADFGQSIIDGRLFKQANRLAWSDPQSVIILEGNATDARSVGISRNSIQGALVTLSLIYRIPILRSLSPCETASLMVYASRQLTKFRDGTLRRPGYRPKGKRKQKLYVLQSLPGVGPRRAEALLETFGSVEAVIESDYEELCEIDGIGPDVATRIRDTVKESPATYGVSGSLFADF